MLKIITYLGLWSAAISASINGIPLLVILAVVGMFALIMWRHRHRLPSRPRRAKRKASGQPTPTVAKLPL